MNPALVVLEQHGFERKEFRNQGFFLFWIFSFGRSSGRNPWSMSLEASRISLCFCPVIPLILSFALSCYLQNFNEIWQNQSKPVPPTSPTIPNWPHILLVSQVHFHFLFPFPFSNSYLTLWILSPHSCCHCCCCCCSPLTVLNRISPPAHRLSTGSITDQQIQAIGLLLTLTDQFVSPMFVIL